MNNPLTRRNLIVVLVVGILVLVPFTATSAYVSFYRMTYTPGMGIGLPAYPSVIDAYSDLMFNQYQWDQTNATKVTFTNVYMNAGPAIPLLTVITTQNLTFSVLTNQEISYDVVANGTQKFSQVSEPLNVTIDGVDKPASWTYDSSSQVLTITNTTSNTIILFSAVSTGGLSSDDVLGICIGLIVAFFAASLAIFTYKKKETK